MGRPAKPLVVNDEDRAQLESMARSQSLPAALAWRALEKLARLSKVINGTGHTRGDAAAAVASLTGIKLSVALLPETALDFPTFGLTPYPGTESTLLN